MRTGGLEMVAYLFIKKGSSLVSPYAAGMAPAHTGQEVPTQHREGDWTSCPLLSSVHAQQAGRTRHFTGISDGCTSP